MRTKSIIFILVISMFAGRLYSQHTGNKNAYPVKPVKAYKGVVNIEKNAGLGYFSDPSENLLDFYHFNLFPDSIYGYNHDSQIGIYLNTRSYFNLNNKTLHVKNYSDIHYATGDTYYYNETSGLLDSAILESEGNWEYDYIAVKHVYTYAENLMKTEVVYIDTTYDSVDNDWEMVEVINYSYDSDSRIKEKSIFQANQFYWNTSYYYNVITSDSIIRTDTTFTNYYNNWVPDHISITTLNSKNECTQIQNFQYTYYFLLKPDSFGVPDPVNKIDMKYDSAGDLLSETITRYDGGQPAVLTNLYEYNINDTRKLKTIIGNVPMWEITYQNIYYYNTSATKTKEIENAKFMIFPNPAYDVLHIEGISIGSKVSIYSMDGKIVRSQIYGNSSISVSDLPEGIYLINMIEIKGHSLNRVFIKK